MQSCAGSLFCNCVPEQKHLGRGGPVCPAGTSQGLQMLVSMRPTCVDTQAHEWQQEAELECAE